MRCGRALYGALVALHPRGFRASFGAEMLLIYDDAMRTHGEAWLVRDAAASLLRQWVLRGPETETSPGFESYMGLMSGQYPGARPPHLTAGKVSMAFVLSVLLTLLISPV
jgi:hypothetical protein